MIDSMYLPHVYWGLLALSIFIYAVLDGYDLGVGMLMPLRDKADKDKMVASIGPFWDANETWLVLIVGLLFIAFPKAHSFALSYLYLPVFVMLIGLILRGIAFDFRVKAPEHQRMAWDYAFKIGSAIAALSQGYMIGRYVTGFEESVFAYAFAVLSSYGVAIAYCFIGAAWLILKTEGALQKRAIVWAQYSSRALFFGIAAICWFSFMLYTDSAAEKMSNQMLFISILVPSLCLFLFIRCEYNLTRKIGHDDAACWKPFVNAILVFLVCMIGLAYTIFPYIIPGKMLLVEVASAPESLAFLLVGASVVIPLILLYTAFTYWVFRGKVRDLSYE
tara:strand:- start:5316 stop:6314 length:999 start_codon:yes stop_codon:yes gene_type:complete